MFPLLTLDESTLFYWTHSHGDASLKKQKHSSAINEWALAIPAQWRTKPRSQVLDSTSSTAKTDIPLLTCGTSDCSYAPSVLSDNVKIFSHQSRASDVCKVKAKPQAVPALSIYNDGGLLDNDEIKGEEQQVAINSPQGKKTTHQRSILFFLV